MEIKGVILAGGKGVRMQPFTDHYPKPILPIGNRPLLYYQIGAMRRCGIKEIIVVISHLGYQIVRLLGDGSQYGVNIKYIEQGQTLGIAHAVYKLEQEIDNPFLLFLGDIFFQTENLSDMVRCLIEEKVSAVLATKVESNPQAISRNFSVLLGEEGYVERVIEKPRHAYNNLKGCGIYLFNPDIFDALRRTPRTAMRDEYEITDAIQILIDDGQKVVNRNVIKEDINLTYPIDLLFCNFRAMRQEPELDLIGSGSMINDRTVIENSVIGRNVQVTHEVTIKDSVIFDDVEIPSNIKEIRNMIFTPFQHIQC